jgi:hypothetical protein
MTQWIESKTKVPEPLLDILVAYVFDGESTIDMAFRRDNGRWFLTGSEPLIEIHPTHWMPLPELP